MNLELLSHTTKATSGGPAISLYESQAERIVKVHRSWCHLAADGA
jgi:hypothetical protein